MKKIEAWKTDDGKIWESESKAKEHEARIEAIDSIRATYYSRMIDCDNDLIAFLDDNKIIILKFYGVD